VDRRRLRRQPQVARVIHALIAQSPRSLLATYPAVVGPMPISGPIRAEGAPPEGPAGVAVRDGYQGQPL
jgi:hypothetical protein